MATNRIGKNSKTKGFNMPIKLAEAIEADAKKYGIKDSAWLRCVSENQLRHPRALRINKLEE